ncbi:MAG: glycoside hydrolase family 2, partial [Candidatus Nephrothrix sp. EaCA]
NIGDGSLTLKFGPADSKLLVFDKNKKGQELKPVLIGGSKELDFSKDWEAELRHINGTVKKTQFHALSDLKDMPDYVHFSGTIIYRKRIDAAEVNALSYLNLGKVYGISEVTVNGKNAGLQWHGNRIFEINKFLLKGSNAVEIKVITTMGNYMKTLTDNPIAQYWTNEKRKNQPLQSMGLCGPVKIY